MSVANLSLFAPLREAYEASRAVRTDADRDAVLERVATLVSETLGWGTVVVAIHRRAWDDFLISTVQGDDEAREELLGTTRTWPEWAPTFSDRHARRGAHLVDDRVLVLMRGTDGEVTGILVVSDPASGQPPEDDEVDALVVVANAAGAALQQAREMVRDSEHRAALEHLLSVSTRMADARSSTIVLEAVCAGIHEALGFDRVVVELANEDGSLRPHARVGWDAEDATVELSLSIDDLALLQRPEHEEHGCLLLDHIDAEQILGLPVSPYSSRSNGRGPWAWSRHWLMVPLRDREGRLIGMIWPDEPRDRLLPDSQRLQALRLFADQAQAALESASQYEQALHRADHDGLTGLPNRRVLLDRLRQALLRAQRTSGTVAVLFVDLDRFKAVNDTYGHECGDEVLRTVAARIDAQLRAVDTLARLGGDEFVVLCEDVGGEDEALEVAQRLRAQLARPIQAAAGAITVTASVGVALPAGPADSARALLRDADVAMYRAKQAGRNSEQVASASMRAGATARARLERALDGALEREEIRLYWQPIVAMATGEVIRVEALMRWDHPGLGWVSPIEFIPLAEETGFIVDLGRWAMAEACGQAAQWRTEHGAAAPGIAVNLSPRQLRDPLLLDLVGDLLTRHQLPAGMVCAEITEGVLLDGTAGTKQVLESLRELGVHLDLDDFGTGYSSLSSLEQFAVDGLKIDRRFVAGRDRDARAGAIVEALLVMARALGLRATAEGVETVAQRDWLASLDCDLAQGFLFARPQPADQVERLFGAGAPPAPAAG